MGLDDFISDGPRTYKKGGKKDPNSSSRTSQDRYDNHVYNGVIHVPEGIETPDLAQELSLKVIKVRRLDYRFADSVFVAMEGDRVATSFEAMVKVDKLNNIDIEGIDELVDAILEDADNYDFLTIGDEKDNVYDNDETEEQEEENSQSGIQAFM